MRRSMLARALMRTGGPSLQVQTTIQEVIAEEMTPGSVFGTGQMRKWHEMI